MKFHTQSHFAPRWVCVCVLRKQFNHFCLLSITPQKKKSIFTHVLSSRFVTRTIASKPSIWNYKKAWHEFYYLLICFFLSNQHENEWKSAKEQQRKNFNSNSIRQYLKSRQKIMHTSRQFQQDLNEYFDVPVLVVSVCFVCLFGWEVVLTVQCWHGIACQ